MQHFIGQIQQGKLFVHGFSAFCEGPTENKTGNEVYRQTLQTNANVAGPRPSFD